MCAKLPADGHLSLEEIAMIISPTKAAQKAFQTLYHTHSLVLVQNELPRRQRSFKETIGPIVDIKGPSKAK